MTSRRALSCSLVLSLVCTAVAADVPKADASKAGPRFESASWSTTSTRVSTSPTSTTTASSDIISGPSGTRPRSGSRTRFASIGIGRHGVLREQRRPRLRSQRRRLPDVISGLVVLRQDLLVREPGQGRAWPRARSGSSTRSSTARAAARARCFRISTATRSPRSIINHWDGGKPMTIVQIKPGKEGPSPSSRRSRSASPRPVTASASATSTATSGRTSSCPAAGSSSPASDWSAKPWTFHKHNGFNLDHTSVPCLVVDRERRRQERHHLSARPTITACSG